MLKKIISLRVGQHICLICTATLFQRQVNLIPIKGIKLSSYHLSTGPVQHFTPSDIMKRETEKTVISGFRENSHNYNKKTTAITEVGARGFFWGGVRTTV